MTDQAEQISANLQALLDQKAAVDAALNDTMDELQADLIDAKTAYSADPSSENKVAKHQAAVNLQALRKVLRADRTGVGVGGDAVVTPGSED